MVFKYDIAKFKLRPIKGFRKTDDFIKELDRKVMFNNSTASEYVGRYLDDKITYLISRSLLILLLAVVVMFCAIKINIFISIASFILFTISIYFYIKALDFVKRRTFYVGFFISMSEIYLQSIDEK